MRVSASGVNRADLAQMAGHYPAPPGEPEILGLEVSGVRLDSEARICALLAGGGHAELVAAPEGQIFPAPGGIDPPSAAAIPEAFLTAFVNLVIEAGLERGQTLLVHAGASGVGLAAIGLGKFLGARVAATTRTGRKLAALEREGADLAIDTSAEDFADAVERRWGRGAVDVVLDPIGADTLGRDLRLLATGGRIISIATMSGAKTELDLRLLMSRRARLIGSTLRSRSRAEKATLIRRFTEEALPAFAARVLRPTVDSVYSAERSAEAFARMRSNENVGKIVIDWAG